MTERPRVLLNDDDRLMRMTLRLKLAAEGYQVDEASSGAEATDLLCRYGYDLVLTDSRLRDMSGVEIVRLARSRDPLVSIMVLTGSGDSPEIEEAARAGATAVRMKPCRLAELTRNARDLVARKRAQAGS